MKCPASTAALAASASPLPPIVSRSIFLSSSWASRAVQALFLIALISLWTFATTWGHVSPILLPNPLSVLDELIDVLKTGEFVGDLRVTLTELAADPAVADTLRALQQRRLASHGRANANRHDGGLSA